MTVAGQTERMGVQPTEDITTRLDNLAQSLAGEYPPHTLMDLAEAASLITTLRATLAGQHRREAEVGTPDGWVLVPREPTPEMLINRLPGTNELHRSDVWDAMLAASPSSPASGGRVTCVFCAKELGEDAVSDEAGALAHPACAEIELLTQKVEQYAAFVKLVDQSPQPERMSGAHLSTEARAQAAFAIIDNFKRQAAALSALGGHP